MARRRGPSRMDLRRANEAAERSESDSEDEDEDEIVDEDDLDEEDEDREEDEDLDVDIDPDAEPVDEEDEDEVLVVKKKKKPAAKKASRAKSTKKKVDNQRKRLIWGVFDNSMNMVASFSYTDRTGADAKAKELTDKGRGAYFVQPVKEPMPLEDK